MVITHRPSNSTAYLEKHPELLFGFVALCESTGLDWRGYKAAIQDLRSEKLDLREQPGANRRGDEKNAIQQRNGNEAANWLSNGMYAATILTFATGTVANDGSPSPRSIRRCWSHGGRGSPQRAQ
jgi:hypothetical protein